VGSSGIALSDGNYVVLSPAWNGNRGAATWADGASGRTLDGNLVVTPQNSVVGQTASSGAGLTVSADPLHQSLIASFSTAGTGRVASGFADPNQLSYARGQTQTVTITPDLLTRTLDTGSAVVLQASNDITIEDPILVSAGGHGGSLTLQTGRSILLNASISTDNGALTLIANDQLASGVVDGQRDPGAAIILVAPGTTLDTGSGSLTVELRDGSGRSNTDSGAITLQTISAGMVSVSNTGPSPGSDVVLGPVSSSTQSYSNPNGTTEVAAPLSGDTVTFADAVHLDAGQTVSAGVIDFSGSSTQTLQANAGSSLSTLLHSGSGTLQLLGDLQVSGDLTNSGGTIDANGWAVNVGGLSTLVNGTSYLGVGSLAGITASAGGLSAGGLASPGLLTSTGEVSLSSAATFSVRLNGTGAGNDYDQLSVQGTVDLASDGGPGSSLAVSVGYVAAVGDSYTILHTTGGVLGTFAGLAEGDTFTSDGRTFQITYAGNGGTDVVLTCVG
jgi:hypothetical protein